MKKKFFYAASASLMMLPLASCSDSSDSGEVNEPRREVVMSRAEVQAVADLTDFSFKLFDASVAQVAADSIISNIAVSPLGVSMLLGMISNGVEGATQAELLKAMLGDENANIDELNALMAKLMAELPALDKKVDVKIANSMWHTDNIVPSGGFVNAMNSCYNADVNRRDLNSKAVEDEINNWARSSTSGSIDSIYLVNQNPCPTYCIYSLLCFDGKWGCRFDKDLTKLSDFRNADLTVSTVDMMSSGSKTYPVKMGENYVSVSMPYGSGSFMIDLFLPSEGSVVDDVAATLAAGGWRRHSSMQVSNSVSVKLPRFELRSENDLLRLLKRCGIEKMFEKSDDFAPMTSGSVGITSAAQGISISVDEDGTKIKVVTSSSGDMSYFAEEMIFDEPFLYVIHEKSTGAVVLTGIVNRL